MMNKPKSYKFVKNSTQPNKSYSDSDRHSKIKKRNKRKLKEAFIGSRFKKMKRDSTRENKTIKISSINLIKILK